MRKKKKKTTKKVAVKKKVAKKKAAPRKKVAKKKAAPRKKVAKKKAAPRKKVAKKKAAPRKKVAKKKAAPRKKVAKKKAAPRKKVAKKKAEAQTSSHPELSREEAIKKYKSEPSLTPKPKSLDLFSLSDKKKELALDGEDIMDSEEEKFQRDDEILYGTQNEQKDSKMNEEYDADDEKDDDEDEFGYGWGYNEQFDNPDEEELGDVDEDERYMRGIDSDSETDKS